MDNNKNKTVPVKEKIHLVVENSDTKKSQEVELEDMTLSVENSSNGPLLKFYDKDHKLIAINQNDGRGFLPSSRYADILSLKTKTVEGLSLEILLIEAPFKDKLMKSFLARVTFVMLNIALTVTLHCKVCFPIVAVMIAFPAFLPVTLPFLETDAIFLSDEDHFTALFVPDTFKVVLFPENNEITVLLSFGVAALTDNESKDMADDKIKAMARNMLSVFF